MAGANREAEETTVLVVDDEAGMRRACARMLRKDGFHVVVAGSGREALALAAAETDRLRLALLDVVMPEMTGPELARELRARWPHIKVLYMSGYASDDAGAVGAVGPAEPFLGKPFAADVLRRKVREVLGESAAAGG